MPSSLGDVQRPMITVDTKLVALTTPWSRSANNWPSEEAQSLARLALAACRAPRPGRNARALPVNGNCVPPNARRNSYRVGEVHGTPYEHAGSKHAEGWYDVGVAAPQPGGLCAQAKQPFDPTSLHPKRRL